LLKVSKDGIVTRNCGPESGKTDSCEWDVHGNKICHCLTDFCNAAAVNGVTVWTAVAFPVVILLLVVG
jgi:hypothetical protein